MSELMSNPTSEPELEAAESVDRAADTGSAEPASRQSGGSVPCECRLLGSFGQSRGRCAISANPGRPQNRPSVRSRGDDGSAHWPVFWHEAWCAIGRAGIRGAIRYPRTSAWTGLSILILGGILLTRPAKPTPLAQVSSSPAAPSQDEKKEPEEKAKPKAVVGAERQPKPLTENKGPRTDPRRQPRHPPQLLRPRRSRATPTSWPKRSQAPAPAPLPSPTPSPTQAESAPHPDTTTPTLPDPGPELPPTDTVARSRSLLDSGPDLPPVPSATAGSPALTPVDTMPLPTGKEVTLTGGFDSADPQTTPATPQGPVRAISAKGPGTIARATQSRA